MLLQTVIGPSLIQKSPANYTSPLEREIIRLAWNLGKGIRPKDVMNHYDVNFRTARKWLQSLVDKGYLRPIIKNTYICYYEPIEGLSEGLF